jgi:hypothetical protein
MGLEVVVRPLVLPNIRPPVALRIASPDDPTKGLASLGGSGGGTFVGTSYSFSMSYSSSHPKHENKRQVDVERVYQKDGKGSINRNNYIDVQRTKKIKLITDDGYERILYASVEQPDNVETIEENKDVFPTSGSAG